jgi:glucan phosphoethanolaminetransferase (alkaline phosphatase superfamily)
VSLVRLRSVGWLAFASQFVLLDVFAGRGGAVLHERRQALGWIASLSIAALLYRATPSKAARIVVGALAGAIFAVQAITIRHFGTSLDIHFVESALAEWHEVRAALVPLLPRLVITVVIASAVEAFLLGRTKPPLGSRAVRPALAVVALAALLLGPALDRSTPDLRLVAALRAVLRPAKAAVKSTTSLPPLEARRRTLPRVLLVVTESVRAKDYCSAYAPTCELAPELNALLPTRVALSELRAIGSFTAISVAAIASGQTQLGTREEIALAPTFFDILRAIDAPSRIATAYYGAHHTSGVWERSNVRDSVDVFVAQDELEDEPGTRDHVIVDRFEAYLKKAQAPYFAMLHLYGTHVPYTIRADKSPFQPETDAASWGTVVPLHNRYKNAILLQDEEIARSVRAFLAAPGPWVVLFTSDHGEAFGEHHAIHHGQGLYDEQIHVPGFIAWGGGALDDVEAATLRARAQGPTSHLDMLPTVLDIFGVWDAFALVPLRAKLPGSSLLRVAPKQPRAVPITSCTTSMPCALNNWGMLGDHHALVADIWDARFHCIPLDDTGSDVDHPECASLVEASHAYFPKLPNGSPNR